MNCQFESALALSDTVISRRTDEPVGYVMKLMAIGLRDLDYDMIMDSTLFEQTYLSCMKILNSAQNKGRPGSYFFTMRGFANASYATYYLRQEKYFKAMSTGLDAMKDLKKAKKIDPQNYDADFFLGLYEYAKSELRKKLWMVLFWYPGDKMEGIRKLETAAEKGTIVADAAQMALIDIYTEEKRWDDAVETTNSLLERFPDSRFVLWSKARYFESRKKFKKAADVYASLAKSYERHHRGGHNAIVTSMHRLDQFELIGDRAKTLQAARYICNDLCTGNQKDHKLCKRARKINEELSIETSN
ncbi:MAG: tetratricopeptide repeat protein [Chitinispirillaceae bacterium]